MAQKVVHVLVDDLDGREADETVTFGLDGATFEIDLRAANAEGLRGVFDDYIPHARRTRGRIKRGVRPRVGKPDNSAQIREWALANGVELAARGRIPKSVREQFDKAQKEEKARKRPSKRRVRKR